MNFMILSIIVFAVIMLLALILLFKEKPWVKREKYPEGYWLGVGLGMGIGICMPVGLLLGIAMENIPVGIALGPALGAGTGSVIGRLLEKRHREPGQPVNEEEELLGNWLKKASLLIALLGLMILAILLFTR
jgi:amino acid transporter